MSIPLAPFVNDKCHGSKSSMCRTRNKIRGENIYKINLKYYYIGILFVALRKRWVLFTYSSQGTAVMCTI